MGDVLSQSQIDELLNSFSTMGSKAFDDIEEQSSEKKIKPYDFKMPKKFTKEQLKVIDSIYEIYSRLLSSYLTGLTRLYCKVKVLQIEEQRYYEFNNALSDYIMMGFVNMGIDDEDIMDTICMIQLSNPVTFSLMDRLLGGYGSFVDVNRDFTEIEVGLMTGVFKKMAFMMKEAWSSHIDINPTLAKVETNARVSQSIAPDEVIVLATLELEIKEVKNIVSLCIPAVNMESIMAKFGDKFTTRNIKRYDANRENERREEILQGVKNSSLKIDVILSETQVELYDILNLQINDIIPLNMPITDNVTVKIGNQVWYDGKLGIKNNKKAVRIDNIFKN